VVLVGIGTGNLMGTTSTASQNDILAVNRNGKQLPMQFLSAA